MAAPPKIYHITHIDNLPQIINNGLYSDAERIQRGFNCALVGMSRLKTRRLEEVYVTCHAGTRVGEYVPFYFCPRSVMLYLLHRGNHSDLTYNGGQRPILHLEADALKVIDWAESHGIRWAFTNGNASARYSHFLADASKLRDLDWGAIHDRDWSAPMVKEAKQAEFLIHAHLPWFLIDRIGVMDTAMKNAAGQHLTAAVHRPGLLVAPEWYY